MFYLKTLTPFLKNQSFKNSFISLFVIEINIIAKKITTDQIKAAMPSINTLAIHSAMFSTIIFPPDQLCGVIIHYPFLSYPQFDAIAKGDLIVVTTSLAL
jgi:hypothetical protein